MSKINSGLGVVRNNSYLVIFAAVVLIATALTGGVFLRFDNLSVILAVCAVYGLLALGQGLVIITGGFDLSVGAVLALCISVVANLKTGMGIMPATLVMIAVSLAAGTLNGVLVAFTKIPPFIVTLGMMSICNSLALIFIPGQQIRVGEYKETLEPLFSWMPFGSNSFPIVLIIAVGAAIAFLLHSTRLGRYIYAVGSNERTAIVSGVPVRRVRIAAYAVSGLMCGLAAVAYLYRSISAAPGATADYLLYSIAATMIGGVSMYGGSGKAAGLIVGVFCLASINSVLVVAGIPPAVHKAVLGGIVLLAVSSQWFTRKR